MKGLAIILLAVAAACAHTAQAPAQEERNRSAVRDLFERVWNNSQFERLSELWAPEVIVHFRGHPQGQTRSDVRQMITRYRAAFADLHYTVEDIVAESDRVAVRLTFRGTQRGEFFHVAPTGKQVTVSETMFFRLADGRIIEAWEEYDEYGMRQQLGAPTPR